MRVCPWCEMEVYDDPESGEVESICPYCENELSDYRSIPVEIKDEVDPAQKQSAIDTGNLSRNRLKSEWFGELDSEEDLELDEDPLWDHYDEVARKLQDTADETWSCSNCNELMVQVGEHVISTSDWNGRKPKGWKKPLLTAPFKMTIWLCPGCFRMEQALSETDRNQLIANWSEHGGALQ